MFRYQKYAIASLVLLSSLRLESADLYLAADRGCLQLSSGDIETAVAISLVMIAVTTSVLVVVRSVVGSKVI